MDQNNETELIEDRIELGPLSITKMKKNDGDTRIQILLVDKCKRIGLSTTYSNLSTLDPLVLVKYIESLFSTIRRHTELGREKK